MPSIVIQHAWLCIAGVMYHPLIHLATLAVNVMSMMDDVNFEHIKRRSIPLRFSHCQRNNLRKLINTTHFAYAAKSQSTGITDRLHSWVTYMCVVMVTEGTIE